jgi:hypothetical protein
MMRDLSLHTFNIFTMAINMFARVVLVLIGLILSYECDAFIVAPHQTNRLETALPVSISREDKWLSSVLLSASLVMIPLAAGAVSGGGLDYANLDITGQDFSRGNYKGKDFTQGTSGVWLLVVGSGLVVAPEKFDTTHRARKTLLSALVSS